MKYHFKNANWAIATRDGPVAEADRDALVDALQVRRGGLGWGVGWGVHVWWMGWLRFSSPWI
jgi:hypothetical protein